MSLGEIPSVCEVAIQYAAAGFRVIPVLQNKQPAFKDWPNLATRDPQVVNDWWRKYPSANVGICPDDDFCILDIDVKNGGFESLARLEAEHGKIQGGGESTTGGGGKHFFFRVDPTRELNRKPAGKDGGIEIIHKGHQAIEFPSIHASGNRYLWIKDIRIIEKGWWPMAPEWFYKPLQPVAAGPTPAPMTALGLAPRPYMNGSEGRFHAYCMAALANQRSELAGVVSGNRNEALNIAALKLGHLAHYGFFTEAKAREELRFACDLNGLIADDGLPAFEATFLSGWRKGITEPKDIPDRDHPAIEGIVVEAANFNQPTGEIAAPVEDFITYEVNDDFCSNIPPRQWLYGRKIIKDFCTLLVSPGGVGKTAFTIGVALACQTGKALLKDKPHKPMNVWGIWLEEPKEEIQRRTAAARMYYKPGFADATPAKFIATGREQTILLAKQIGRDEFIMCPDVERLENQIRRQNSEVVIIDPFIKTHAVEENNNSLIEKVTAIFNGIAARTNCAIFLVHHTRKGAQAGDAESARGGGAIVGNVRAAFTLAAMSQEDAKAMGVSADERRFLIRLDDAKANMAPKAEDAEWMKLIGQDLGNGTTEYPYGDNVQVISQWLPPDLWEGVSVFVANQILDVIDAGQIQEDGTVEYYTQARNSKERWAGIPIMRLLAENGQERNEAQAQQIINKWMKCEPPILEIEDYMSGKGKEKRKRLVVNNAARPGPK